MKKTGIILGILVIMAVPIINKAQVGEGTSTSGNSCKNSLLQAFASCLGSGGVNYYVTNVGANSICVNAVGQCPPGHIQSCIAHYDNSRSNCPDAPTIVFQTGVSGGSNKRVIINNN